MAQQRTQKCSHFDRNLLRNTKLNRKFSQVKKKVAAITLATHYCDQNSAYRKLNKKNNKCPKTINKI